MAISSNNDKNDNKVDKKQQTRVVSTKITVDQYLSFDKLAKRLFKKGLVEKPLMSTLLRECIVNMLNQHNIERQDSENRDYKADLSNASLNRGNKEEELYQKQSYEQEIPNVLRLQEHQGGIPPTSMCEGTSSYPSLALVNHSDEVQLIQGKKQTKEDVEIEKFFEDRMIDLVVSRYTTTNNFRKDNEKEKKERIAISPRLSESVQSSRTK